jgi:hypothetical protein
MWALWSIGSKLVTGLLKGMPQGAKKLSGHATRDAANAAKAKLKKFGDRYADPPDTPQGTKDFIKSRGAIGGSAAGGGYLAKREVDKRDGKRKGSTVRALTPEKPFVQPKTKKNWTPEKPFVQPKTKKNWTPKKRKGDMVKNYANGGGVRPANNEYS